MTLQKRTTRFEVGIVLSNECNRNGTKRVTNSFSDGSIEIESLGYPLPGTLHYGDENDTAGPGTRYLDNNGIIHFRFARTRIRSILISSCGKNNHLLSAKLYQTVNDD